MYLIIMRNYILTICKNKENTSSKLIIPKISKSVDGNLDCTSLNFPDEYLQTCS